MVSHLCLKKFSACVICVILFSELLIVLNLILQSSASRYVAGAFPRSYVFLCLILIGRFIALCRLRCTLTSFSYKYNAIPVNEIKNPACNKGLYKPNHREVSRKKHQIFRA